MKDFGKRVRARRVKLGLSGEDVAARVGRSHPWMVDIEAGRGNPPAEIITALAIALDDDPAEYLRLAGRTILRAESVTPAPALDPRMAQAIEDAVTRAFDRFADRLVELLDARDSGPRGAQ